MTPDEFVAQIFTENNTEKLAAALTDTVSDLDGTAIHTWLNAVTNHPDMRPSGIRGTGPWDLGVGLSTNPYVAIRVENGSGTSMVIDPFNTPDSRRVASEVRNIIRHNVHGAKISVAAVEPGAGEHVGFSAAVRLAVVTALNDARGPTPRFKSLGFERLDAVNAEACKDPRFRVAMSRAAKKGE